MTSHFLWDGFVLRGRYVPSSVDDAINFYDRHGTLHFQGIERRSDDPQLVDEVLASWHDRVFNAAYTGSELKLQATVTRIERVAVVAELNPVDIDPVRLLTNSVGLDDPDLAPRRLADPSAVADP